MFDFHITEPPPATEPPATSDVLPDQPAGTDFQTAQPVIPYFDLCSIEVEDYVLRTAEGKAILSDVHNGKKMHTLVMGGPVSVEEKLKGAMQICIDEVNFAKVPYNFVHPIYNIWKMQTKKGASTVLVFDARKISGSDAVVVKVQRLEPKYVRLFFNYWMQNPFYAEIAYRAMDDKDEDCEKLFSPLGWLWHEKRVVSVKLICLRYVQS
eukprot:Colp12_sorted_trinity150504_noHs@14584